MKKKRRMRSQATIMTLTTWWNAWARISKSSRQGSHCQLPPINLEKISKHNSITKWRERSKDMTRRSKIRKSLWDTSVDRVKNIRNLILRLKMNLFNKRLISKIWISITKLRKSRMTENMNKEEGQELEVMAERQLLLQI